MADVGYESDFGSHFLDSMLEVQMTEEDKELDVSKNDDPLNTLPPIPTFDLQSETLTYKDVYNAFPQPVLTTLPIANSTPSAVPLVIKPSPMLIYSGEMPSPQPTPVMTSVQTVTPKTVVKAVTKNVKVGVAVKSTPDVKNTIDKTFLRQLFVRDFIRNVFTKADPPSDIAVISNEEMKYYNTCFKDVSKVQYCRLHCTICDTHLGCAPSAKKKINIHSMLKVLTCKPCFEFYGDGNFPCDKGDNCEIYCRWCGQGGALVCCSFCPKVFCKKCVKRNFGAPYLRKLEKATDWACFCCAQKPLWPLRAVCRALIEFLEKRKNDPKMSYKDMTSCCAVPTLSRKKLRLDMEKTKVPPQPESQIKFTPPVKTPDVRNKTYPSPKTLLGLKDQQLFLNPVVQMKPSDRVKLPTTAPRDSTPKPKTVTNIFSPRSVIAGENVIRGVTTTAPTKLFSAFPSSQLIQSRVIPSDPLMNSTPRILVQTTPPANSTINTSCVRVSLTHQAPSLDVNKIPTVKVPALVQGLFLRLIFPDNKMQYVRLIFDGVCSETSKDFPTPQFKEKSSFIEENLAEAFKINKMMHEKLMKIKEKVSSRTKFTEKSVLNSSVKKLHMDYENFVELYKDLGKTLMEKHEKWKNDAKNTVDVIDISDDETIAKKSKPVRNSNAKETRKNHSDDSDIEILDDCAVNGKPPSSNFKEKYRLKKPENGKSPGYRRKRKRKLKPTDKRLKINRIQNGQPEEDPLKINEPEKAEGDVSSPRNNLGNVGEVEGE